MANYKITIHNGQTKMAYTEVEASGPKEAFKSLEDNLGKYDSKRRELHILFEGTLVVVPKDQITHYKIEEKSERVEFSF